jgi:capsular exopolysaccharide synthesis family protein
MESIKPPAPPAPAAPAEARLHFLDYWRVIRIRKAIIITVFLITAIIATAVTFILPESFASTAKIKVENDGGIIQGSLMQAANGPYDPFFIQTTFEIMQSQLVLSNVISAMNLNDVWGKKYFNGETLKTSETMEILKGRMALAPVRNTKLIAITVYSDDKNEAASIANQIAEAYKNYRVSTLQKTVDTGLNALMSAYLEESNALQSIQTNVDFMRHNFKIIDEPTSREPTPTLDRNELLRINDAMRSAEQDYNKQAEKLNSLKFIYTNTPGKLRDILPNMVSDTELSGMLSQLHEAQRNKAKLLVDNSDSTNNLSVTRVQKLIETLDTQIDDRIAGIMQQLETELGTTKAAWDTLQNKVTEAKNLDFENATKFQPYYAEKRKLLDMTESHKMLGLKITAMITDKVIPTTSMVQLTDAAEPGKTPVKPNKPVNIILGLVFGLVMGIGLAFFIEYLDTSVKTIDDVERTFQAPVLGVIPQNIGYLLEEGSESKHAEAYRVLRTNLLFSRQDEKLNTIVIVSAGAGEGKSTTTINLATVFAQAGNRVLIVDSDLRRPTLHKLFKVANNLGLTNYLLKQNTLAEIVQTTQVPNLDFMASGKLPNSAMGILGSAQMKEMISEMKQRYDFIFFDSPPILGVSDASILASEVDLVMQVIQYRRYPQPMTVRAKQMIEKVGGNFVGLVLNNINMSQDEGYYYYSGYYHDYYYTRTAAEQDADAKGVADKGDTETTLKTKT